MKKLIALIAIMFAATAGSVAMADGCGVGGALSKVAEEAVEAKDDAMTDTEATIDEADAEMADAEAPAVEEA